MMAVLSWCRNSTGSSTVTTWTGRFTLISSMMAASVVDLPLPVTPVTSTRPFMFMHAVKDQGRAQFVDGLNLHWNQAKHNARVAVVAAHVYAEARRFLKHVRDVELHHLFVFLDVRGFGDAQKHSHDVVLVENHAGLPHELAVDTKDRRIARFEVNIRCPAVYGLSHQLMNVHESFPRDCRWGRAPCSE